jgi:hypothetical protein
MKKNNKEIKKDNMEGEEKIEESSLLKENKPKEKIKKNNKEKIKSNNKPLFLAIGIILIIIFSIFMISKIPLFNEEKKNYNEIYYNGFLFLNYSGEWYTYIQIPGKNQPHEIEMRNGPMEVDDIFMELIIKDIIYDAEQVLLTTDPDLSSKSIIAMFESGKIIGDKYDIINKPIAFGLTKELFGKEGAAEIITCEYSTEKSPVIYFRLGDKTEIFMEEKCIIVQGTDEYELIRASSRLVYSLIGVI